MKSKKSKTRKAWRPSKAEQEEIDRMAPLVLDYMRNRMVADWHLVKSQHSEWSKEKCEKYLRAVKSRIIRSMRSGI